MGCNSSHPLDDYELGKGSIDPTTMAIHPSLVSQEIININAIGHKAKDESSGKLYFTSKRHGIIKNHVTINGLNGETICTIVEQDNKKGGAFGAPPTLMWIYFCKDMPAYKNQEPLSSEELKKHNLPKGTLLYKTFRNEYKYNVQRGTIITCSKICGKENLKTLYTFEYVGRGLRGAAIVKENDNVVAKINTNRYKLEVAAGVDILTVHRMFVAWAEINSGAG